MKQIDTKIIRPLTRMPGTKSNQLITKARKLESTKFFFVFSHFRFFVIKS